MKYVKLFEEFEDSFDSKYELKPGVKFPEEGIIKVHAMDELISLLNLLEEKGYVDVLDEKDYAIEIMEKTKLHMIKWGTDSKAGKFIKFIMKRLRIFETHKFHDLFQLKHEYRGHKLKRYGV